MFDDLIKGATNFATSLFGTGSAVSDYVRTAIFGNVWTLLAVIFIAMFALGGGRIKLGDVFEVKI